LRAQSDVLRAQNARLGAEIADEPSIAFPADLLARKGEPRVGEVIASQTALFEARQRASQGIAAVLRQRAEQLRSEIASYEGLLRSVQEQLVSINGELKDVRELVDKGYERRPRLLTLQRQASALTGTKDQHQAMIARARQAITETELQIAQQANTRRNEIATERRDNQAQTSDVEEKLRSAQDVRVRRDVTAPTDGLVTNLRFHTIGGVVKPGDPLLDIVADNEALMVELRINPTDIDTVEVGQEAEVRLTAFKLRTMPTLIGKVTYVAADVEIDQKAGVSFYRGRVQIDQAQLRQAPNAKLTSGMPAEVMILAGERTLLQYLVQPLLDSFRRAFREQ
jgi:HlyD family type I secretion membrane fusion protein